MTAAAGPGVVVRAGADDAASARLRYLGDRPVSWCRIAGGKHHGAIGERGGETVERAVRLALELHLPLVGELDTSGAELRENVAALHAWGRLARAIVAASGVVPTVLVVTGPCVSGPALALGLVDVVVMTTDAFAFLSGPDSVIEFTGETVSRDELGGATMHGRISGVATLVVDDPDAALRAVESVLSYLPTHHLDAPPRYAVTDAADRPCAEAATCVPDRPSASYDVRRVVDDVLDCGSLLELRSEYAPNLVTALGLLAGMPVGVVANQPAHRAGTLDIEASRKAARFVGWCDAFNVPLLTFVDTPGFEPGRDLEWRGMIRHGAELVHAYAKATVPRLCIVLRKAYGGAYIVMDSRRVGNDLCVAWPGAEIAVMGAAGAVEILHGRRLRALSDEERAAEAAALVEEYETAFANPYRAAERGVVDAVIDPASTRAVLARALDAVSTKRDVQVARRHANGPL